ncbi:MAG: transglutaminase family protein [SAR324 cluster bacterium]|nr:transglutaminase family protein [SAR324 cluster bacterium]
MTIQVALKHETHYQYDRLITHHPHLIRLRPAPHCRTPIQGYSLQVKPKEHFLNWVQDPYGNFLARIVFPEKVNEFKVTVDVIANMTVINPFDFFLEDDAEKFPFSYEASLKNDLAPYLEIKENGTLLKEWVADNRLPPMRTNDFMVEINRRLQQDIRYLIRMEPGIQSCEKTLDSRSGSCRDSAWLLAQILRHMGLATRFASGYLIQLTADVKSLDGPSGPEQDFTDLHAWTEVYIPGAGWIGLDPTSGLLAGEGHLPLACTPNPTDAAPITGSTDKCEAKLNFHMEVERILEDPRVTKPYTEDEWQGILELGNNVEAHLQKDQVNLTMGGEPTFISIDFPDDPEWEMDALGPNKRRLSIDLLMRLKKVFAPKGLLHFGQGKWYPGESLPRWALGCYWRKDGVPLWKKDSLIAQESKDYEHGIEQGMEFISHLAEKLGVDPEHVLPGYEDAVYYIWKEGTLPENIDPLEHDLEDEEGRKRLRTLLERGLGEKTGFVLPLTADSTKDQTRWISDEWRFRRKHMFLIPGDSPMGFRLPLDALYRESEKDRQDLIERDPFEERSPLADAHAMIEDRLSQKNAAHHASALLPETPEFKFQRSSLATSENNAPIPPKESKGKPRAGFSRTALCIEPRQGKLYIFIPPISHLEAWVELIAAIELTASELGYPVMLEGYEPPSDQRLQFFKITPDPGVIEVNIHPASSWEELCHYTTVLYEEARLARLGTEKFLLDGRHIGTGGGNHVTLGGATPAKSPFLRRPDLLKSLVNFWQNHPSLSFLFSGLFIGPTSQAPRVDEARNDSLYNLEIAFQQTKMEGNPPPWIVDRVFRNILADITGNVHRTEFCIDKLYSPDHASGRQGLVEMRAFEMPPHSRMSLVQMLLLRTVIAIFWKTPYQQKLVPWGTQLHDRFMLPHFVWNDFKDVMSFINNHGFSIEPKWFLPFFEFRFPKYGHSQIGDMQIELRLALEPWNVLGEETSMTGTARYVDSSTERVQVMVDGMTESRHILTCNGRRVPLRPTETPGKWVAGVRFQAWQPPSSLHPTIPEHTPLVFDLVDIWQNRSIGGASYFVSHPGGNNPETRPINAFEAEARRLARFWNYGHTPGKMDPPHEEPNSWFPYTLDLRLLAD